MVDLNRFYRDGYDFRSTVYREHGRGRWYDVARGKTSEPDLLGQLLPALEGPPAQELDALLADAPAEPDPPPGLLPLQASGTVFFSADRQMHGYLVTSPYPETDLLVERCADGRITEAHALAWLRSCADRLVGLARLGRCHGLLRLTTVLVDDQEGARFLHPIMAQAHALSDPDFDHDTRRRFVACQAPEVVRGATPDIRADLFSLGAIAYRLLTGTAAVDDPDAFRIGHGAIDRLLPVHPHRSAPDLSPGTVLLLGHALAFDPQLRYGGPADLVADCDDCLAGRLPAIATPAGGSRTLWRDAPQSPHPPPVAPPAQAMEVAALAAATTEALPWDPDEPPRRPSTSSRAAYRSGGHARRSGGHRRPSSGRRSAASRTGAQRVPTGQRRASSSGRHRQRSSTGHRVISDRQRRQRSPGAVASMAAQPPTPASERLGLLLGIALALLIGAGCIAWLIGTELLREEPGSEQPGE